MLQKCNFMKSLVSSRRTERNIQGRERRALTSFLTRPSMDFELRPEPIIETAHITSLGY